MVAMSSAQRMWMKLINNSAPKVTFKRFFSCKLMRSVLKGASVVCSHLLMSISPSKYPKIKDNESKIPTRFWLIAIAKVMKMINHTRKSVRMKMRINSIHSLLKSQLMSKKPSSVAVYVM